MHFVSMRSKSFLTLENFTSGLISPKGVGALMPHAQKICVGNLKFPLNLMFGEPFDNLLT